MTDTKPTIEEQIAFEENILPIAAGGMHQAILASLKELAAIKSQPVPVEPYKITVMRTYSEQHGEVLAYIDSLLSQLQVAQMERDGYLDLYRDCADLASDHIELAEKAMERNKHLVELLKALLGALKHPVPPTQKQWDAIGVVSDNILREVGK
jgi:hypothetical protein